MANGGFARYIRLMNVDTETRRKKLLFRAHRRGFKEVDLIFGAFADAHLAGLNEAGLERFEELLVVPDWQIYEWLTGAAPVPAEHDNEVFAALRDYHTNLKA
jgi:antitoxin CptB